MHRLASLANRYFRDMRYFPHLATFCKEGLFCMSEMIFDIRAAVIKVREISAIFVLKVVFCVILDTFCYCLCLFYLAIINKIIEKRGQL